MSQAHDRDHDGDRESGRPPKGERGSESGTNAELLHAQDLLARTVRFLQHCAEDPLAALAAQNPRELIRELEALQADPEPENEDETTSEPRTIPLRRRRSA